MIFSDSDILSRLAEGDLVVDSIDDVDMQVQPASVDLCLGTKLLEFQRTNISCIHPDRENEVSEYARETHVPEGDDFILHPGDFALGTTRKRAEVPTDLLAAIEGRSSLSHLAVAIRATTDIAGPDYKGQITFRLSNLGAVPVALTPGIRILQLVFTEMKSPTDCPYGVKHGSKY